MRDVCSRFYCSKSYHSHHLCAAVQLLIMVRKWVCSLGGYRQTRFRFYYIKTDSVDTCEKIQLNKASDVGLMLTLDDKSYLKYICVTWFYSAVQKPIPRQLESLADLRMNCQVHEPKQFWTLAELASLCQNARWKASLSLSKRHEDMANLSERSVQDVKICPGLVPLLMHSDTEARLTFSHCLYFIRMQSNRRAFFGEWNSHTFPHQIRPIMSLVETQRSLLVINLCFRAAKQSQHSLQVVWPGIKLNESLLGSPVGHNYKSGAIWPWRKSVRTKGKGLF